MATETTTPTIETLTAQHGIWGAHPTWPVEDWKTEVDNDDTRQGYWEWVISQIDLHGSTEDEDEEPTA